MQDNEKEFRIDTLHILLWLVKDALWVMGFKYLAIFMIAPTVLYTFYVLKLNYSNKNYFYNYLAILFWLLGNSVWILNDFLWNEKYVWICYVLFIIGIIILVWQIIKSKIKYVGK